VLNVLLIMPIMCARRRPNVFASDSRETNHGRWATPRVKAVLALWNLPPVRDKAPSVEERAGIINVGRGGTSPRPDYIVQTGSVKLIFEVKELAERRQIRSC
jgi:hypothetical protein